MLIVKKLIGLDRTFRSKNLISYCSSWAVVTIFTAVLFALVVGTISSGEHNFEMDWGAFSVLSTLLLAPIIETYVLIFIAVAAYEFSSKKFIGVLIASFSFAFFHGLQAPQWGIIIFPLFFISVLIYFLNREQQYIKLKIILIHSFHNLYALLINYVAELMFA